MDPRVGVAVFVLNDAGEIIIGKRKGSHGAGTWAPPGGHLDFGESFEACAKREVLEETGLRVSHVRFLTATNDVMEDDRKHYVTLYVGCTIVGENKEPEVREPHKCEQWEWWTWDKVKSSADIPADVNKNGNNAAAKDDGNLGFTGQRLFLPLSNLFKQQPRFVPAQHYAQVSLGIPRNN